jgi:hypothetical protein
VNKTAKGLLAPLVQHQRERVLRWAVVALALFGITTALLAARDGRTAARVVYPVPSLHIAAAAEHPITAQFHRHALNALLVPLIDDHDPPQWTDVALRFFCGPNTRVEVNGQPMQPGTAIPAAAFTVRWHIDQCWPLDYAAFELSGMVDLLVFREDTGLGAVVNAQHLRIATAKGSGQLNAPFAASMALGDSRSAHEP